MHARVGHPQAHARRLRRRRPHPLHSLCFWLNITRLSATATLPRLLICLKLLHRLLDLRSQIRAVEALLMYLAPTALTIPPQAIHAVCRPRLLNYHAYCIRKADRVVRYVAREQKQLAFVYVDVAELVGCGFDCL